MIDLKPNFTEDQMALSKFLTLFNGVCTTYSKITPQNHMKAICRSKGETLDNPKKGDVQYVNPLDWNIKKLLKRTEEYNKELFDSGYRAEDDSYDESIDFDYKRKR